MRDGASVRKGLPSAGHAAAKVRQNLADGSRAVSDTTHRGLRPAAFGHALVLGRSFGEDEAFMQVDNDGIRTGARFTRAAPFQPSDIRAASIDHGAASSWRAWHWFRVTLGGRLQAGLLVLDGAPRDAHSIGEADGLRREITDRLNALVAAEGYEAVVALLRDPDLPLRFEDLRRTTTASVADRSA
jgi:hypothetical protein